MLVREGTSNGEGILSGDIGVGVEEVEGELVVEVIVGDEVVDEVDEGE